MEAKDLYSENKMLMKEIEDNTNRWIYHVLRLEQSILWKQLYYPRQSTDSMQFLSNYQEHFSQNQKKNFFFLICMETQKIPKSQSNPKKG